MLRSVIGSLAALLLAASAALAQQQSYSQTVIDKCRPEAQKLCPEHALGSAEMRYCMEAKGRMISRDCIGALEDDGILPRGTRNKHARSQ